MTIAFDSGVNLPVCASQQLSMSTPHMCTPSISPSTHPTPLKRCTCAYSSAYVHHVAGLSDAAWAPFDWYGTLVSFPSRLSRRHSTHRFCNFRTSIVTISHLPQTVTRCH